MKRRTPEGGHEEDKIAFNAKRIKEIDGDLIEAENKRKLEGDKENFAVASNKRKSFKEALNSMPKKSFKGRGDSENDLDKEKYQQIRNIIPKADLVVARKNEQERANVPPIDNSIPEDQLFPALCEKADENIVTDYSIKNKIKINCSKPMSWINEENFNFGQSLKYKKRLGDILNYFTYPATEFNDEAYPTNTQISKTSMVPEEIKRSDKDWILSFKDCYQQFLAFEDDTESLEYSLITSTYKVLFISKIENVEGLLVRKRFAIVGHPSEILVNALKKQDVMFQQYFKPKKEDKLEKNSNGKLKDHFYEEDILSDEEISEVNLNNYANTQDVFGYFNPSQDDDLGHIHIQKEVDPTTLIIEGIHLHGLVLSLMGLCKPHLKQVKLVAPYSFRNSVHKSADIKYNGKVITSSSSKIDTYSLDLNGIYTFSTIKSILKLFTEKLALEVERSDFLKINCTTFKYSESLNWPDNKQSSIQQVRAVIQKKEDRANTKFYIKYN